MPVEVQIGDTVQRVEMAGEPVTLSMTETAGAPVIDPDRWILKAEGE